MIDRPNPNITHLFTLVIGMTSLEGRHVIGMTSLLLEGVIVNFEARTFTATGQVMKDTTTAALQVGMEGDARAAGVGGDVLRIWFKAQRPFLNTSKICTRFNTFTITYDYDPESKP